MNRGTVDHSCIFRSSVHATSRQSTTCVCWQVTIPRWLFAGSRQLTFQRPLQSAAPTCNAPILERSLVLTLLRIGGHAKLSRRCANLGSVTSSENARRRPRFVRVSL